MTNSRLTDSHFQEALQDYLLLARSFSFPAGESVEIPTVEEVALLLELERNDMDDLAKFRLLAHDLDREDAFSVAILGSRLAVLSVRRNTQSLFHTSLLAAIAGGTRIDWRDLLRLLALLENCSSRLGISFNEYLMPIIALVDSNKVRSTIVDGYLSRSTDMRDIKVMGIIETTCKGEWTFASRSY